MSAPSAFLSMDVQVDWEAHLGHYIGTIGFFVPAVILVALVVGAVVRDRRLHARDTAQDADRDGPTPPRSD